MSRYYVGIDDTDNLESRGTGFHARSLGQQINSQQLGRCRFITRHQLLFSSLVPFTSHNSAACLVVDGVDDARQLWDWCENYLRTESAEGADAGLCLLAANQALMPVMRFGFRCKHQVVAQADALGVARESAIQLAGLTGDKQGLIGALAASALCASGSDGRLLWLNGMRECKGQTLILHELLAATDIEVVQSDAGAILRDDASTIAMGEWPRAIWLNGQATLVVTAVDENSGEWRVAEKSYLKQF